jgi:hypothetical protein
MIFKKYLVLIWAILLASAAVAGDQERTHIKIAVDKDDADAQTFTFDSESAGFDLHSMAVGETQTLTDASGNVATISRTVDGLEVEVAGETLAIGDPGGEHTLDVFVHEDAHHGDVHIDKDVKKIKMIKTGDDESVTIISGGAIDEATRQKIRDALLSGGLDSDVEFIDGSEFDGGTRKEVRVIRKEIDVTN